MAGSGKEEIPTDEAGVPEIPTEEAPAPELHVPEDYSSLFLEDPEPVATPTPTDYGTREDGSPRGQGFLGPQKTADGRVETEKSIKATVNGEEQEIPTLVPGVTPDEREELLGMEDHQEPSPGIKEKAVAHAEMRAEKGRPPFAYKSESPPPATITPDNPRLLDALRMTESAGNDLAVSPAGAKGPFQFMDGTWEQYGKPGGSVWSRKDAGEAAQKYLNTLYKRYDKDINLTIAAYNYGEGNLDKALAKAEKNGGSRTFEDVAPYLPTETRNYVPKILGKFSKTDPQLEGAVSRSQLPGIIGPVDFAKQLSPIIGSPAYQALSATDQIATLNKIYSNNIYAPEVKEKVKELSAAIWKGADPEEVEELKAAIGKPSQAEIAEQKKNPEKFLTEWKAKRLQELEAQGLAPEFISAPFEEHFKAIAQDEKEAYEVRSKGRIGQFIHGVTVEAPRAMLKGAADLITGPAAGFANILGANEAATTIAKLPDALGEPTRFWKYETDDYGHILINKDGTFRETWETGAYRALGNALGMMAGGAGLKILGAGEAAINSGFLAQNVLTIGHSTFSNIYDQTGDKEKAYRGMLMSIPAASALTLIQARALSKFGSVATEGLDKMNTLRVFAKEAAKSSVEFGGGTAAFSALQQGAEISQTGQKFSGERVAEEAGIGALTGAIAGPIIKGIHVSKELAHTNEVQGAVNRTLQRFQNSHEESVTLPVQKKYVQPEVAEALGMMVDDSVPGKTTFTKENFVAEPTANASEAAQKAVDYLTPEEIQDFSHEKALLVEKGKQEDLTPREDERLTELQNKLEGTDEATYRNKIKATEKEYLAQKEADPLSDPFPEVLWDKEQEVWKNMKTGEEHPFLKGAAGLESKLSTDNLENSSDSASPTNPKIAEYPQVKTQKPLTASFTNPTPYSLTTGTNTEPMTTQKLQKSVKEIQKIASKISGQTPFVIKEGGKFRKGVLGYANFGLRAIRLRSVRDIPTFVHEVTHEVDSHLRDITLTSAQTNPKLAAALIEQARTFYPGKAVQKSTSLALREGLTTFLENKVSNLPVHKELLTWWNGDFKAKNPELHAAYEKVSELADAYYSQTPEALDQARYMSDNPGKIESLVSKAKNSETWIKFTDKNFAIRALDKAMGNTGRYNNKSYRAFIDANEHSALDLTGKWINGEHVTDLQGNIQAGRTFKQIFEPLSPELQSKTMLYLDAMDDLTMLKRNQNPGVSAERVVYNIKELLKDPTEAKLIKNTAESYYKWYDQVMTNLTKDSPHMSRMYNAMKEANLRDTDFEHGHYVPKYRQDRADKVSTGGAQVGGTDVNTRRTGSDRNLKPFIERVEQSVRSWTESSLKNQLVDRLIRDSKRGLATGGMLEKVPATRAKQYEADFADIVEKMKIALDKKGANDTTDAFENLVTESGLSEDDFMSTMATWWGVDRNLSQKKAANGYEILVRPKLNGDGVEFYEVHPKLLEAFAPHIVDNDNLFFKAARASKRILQVGATTINPVFQARNFLVRDPQGAMILGKDFQPLKMYKYMAQEVYDQVVTGLKGKTNSVAAWAQRSGMGTATYLGAAKEINSISTKRGMKTSIWKAGEKVVNGIEWVASLGENANRLAAVRITADKLGIDLFDPQTKITPTQAIDLAIAFKNSTVNFAKRGDSKTLNFIGDVVPFFNARLAATSQTIEAIGEHPVRGIGIAGTSFALGLYAYLHNAGKDWYNDLSAETKTSAFVLDMGGDRALSIPLDNFQGVFHGLGVLAGEAIHGGEEIEAGLAEMIQGVVQQASPIDLPIDKKGAVGIVATGFGPIGQQIIEQAFNFSIFRNRPITNELKDVDKQYGPRTSEAIKELGRISGMSPDRIEYFVKTFASGPLTMEKFFETQTGIKPVDEAAGQNFLLRAFTREANNAAIQDVTATKFYETVASLNQAKESETEEQGVSRKLVGSISRKLTALNHTIAGTEDAAERNKLYQYRRDLYKAGIRAAKDPTIDVPTYEEWSGANQESKKE